MSEKEKHFQEFKDALQRATENTDYYYFKIDMAKSRRYHYRERVYCYELYHQLRRTLPNTYPYTLQGEMDKIRHQIIRPKIGAKKPDFILHKPRTMEDNLVVMEVKPLNNTNSTQIKKDLETLTGFLDLDKGYYRAIHLVYGSNGRRDGGISRVIRTYRAYNNFGKLETYRGRLVLYWHKKPKEAAIVYDWEADVLDNVEKQSLQGLGKLT